MRFQIHGVIYRWSVKRFLINFMIVALVAAGFVLYTTRLTTAHSNRKSITVTVRKGDTLWSIAKTIDPQTDPRQIIELIKEGNNLREAALTPGQKLRVDTD